MRREYLIQHSICPCRGREPADPAMAELLKANPSQRVRDTLAAYRLFERGVDAGNTPRAIALHTQALALHPGPQDAHAAPIDIAVALIEQHRLDEAATQLHAAIATLPGNRSAHEELGDVYELQNRTPQALAEFLVDAERGQSWSQMRVASFMLTPAPAVSLDRKTGAFWMRRAADNGEALARDILRRHPELMAAYPPTYSDRLAAPVFPRVCTNTSRPGTICAHRTSTSLQKAGSSRLQQESRNSSTFRARQTPGDTACAVYKNA